MKVDLHMHTKFSDGGSSIQEIFDIAHKNAVKILSITDHTNIDAYKELDKVDKHGINVLNGMELDVCTDEQTIIHVLMYDFDMNDFLREYLNKSAEYDANEFLRMVQDCEDLYGLNFDNNKIENFIKRNQYFDKVRLNDFLVESDMVSSPVEAFYKYTKNIKDKTRYAITEKQLFLLSKKCSAKTFVAHPMKYLKDYKNIENIEKMILRLKKCGLDGVEVFNNRQTMKQEQELLLFAQDNNLMISGGSDYHAKIGDNETKVVGEVLGHNLNMEDISNFFDLKANNS